MKRVGIVGCLWGDEGKGKITDFLASSADVVVRYQGGDNAGHTVYKDNVKNTFHILPSGVLNVNCLNILANGVVINLEQFFSEYENYKYANIKISNRAHIILSIHRKIDSVNELSLGKNRIGTTNRGIGPCYADKTNRIGIRICDLFSENLREVCANYLYKKRNELESKKIECSVQELYSELAPYQALLKKYNLVTDTSLLLEELIDNDKKILFEGAQGVMLCMDHGTYPYCTSSSPTGASIPLNAGISPMAIDAIVGVCKAYSTRVGEGAFPSEIFGNLAEYIRKTGNEYGATTGRERRIGWLDTVVLRHAKRVSGISYLAITLLDVLSEIEGIKLVVKYKLNDEIIDYVPASIEEFAKVTPVYEDIPPFKIGPNCHTYSDLSPEAIYYLKRIEELTKIKIAIISVGKDRKETIEVIKIYD
jgi:adenylosuccinate synthase